LAVDEAGHIRGRQVPTLIFRAALAVVLTLEQQALFLGKVMTAAQQLADLIFKVVAVVAQEPLGKMAVQVQILALVALV
tara:strand:+ start:414 stop:650 length:237 start_codon:yes stop_codon:yes gene_type:complete